MSHDLKPDPTIKYFFREKDRCADIINAFLFHGEEVVHEQDLQFLIVNLLQLLIQIHILFP